MFTFAVDYFIMVFVASIGVMQAAASIGGLRGLLVFKRPVIARPLGIAIAIAAIVWFYMVGERNINDYEGGLDSNEQALLFFLAVAASGLFTFTLTSVLNGRMRRGTRGNESVSRTGLDARARKDSSQLTGNAPSAGLGALRCGSWWHALTQNYRYWFGEARCWRTRIKRYFFG